MSDADDCGFQDVRVADGEIFDVDGRDPLAARLDDVLGAVGDLHEAVGIDGGDVAGVEEAVLVEDLAAFVAEIALDDGEALHLEPAETFAVPRQLGLFSSSTIFISTPNGAQPCFA